MRRLNYSLKTELIGDFVFACRFDVLRFETLRFTVMRFTVMRGIKYRKDECENLCWIPPGMKPANTRHENPRSPNRSSVRGASASTRNPTFRPSNHLNYPALPRITRSRYSFDTSRTLPDSRTADKMVGMAMTANMPSMRLMTASMEATEPKMIMST
jgi:hypothetical protein